MMRSRFACVAVVFLAVFSAVAWAQPESRPDAPGSRPKKKKVDPSIAAHAEATKALVADLVGLAEWADKQKLDRERATVLELILVYEPDNAAAREGLGFVKAKGGGWERGAKWKEPGNRDAEALGDFKKKRAEIGGTFLDAMTKVMEENRRDMDPALKARIVADMNAIDSNDPRSKTAAGEAQVLGKWVLADTAQSGKRRKELQAFAKTAIANAGTPEVSELMGNEGSWDVKWATVVTTENLRVLGTGSKEETIKIAVLCQAAGELFAKTFDVDVPHQSAYKQPIYIITDPTAKANFLLRNSGVKPDKREYYAKLGCFDVDGAIVDWADTTPSRIDCAVRHVIGSFITRSFGVSANEQGALYEGVGIHLSWFLTGTRLTWTIGQRKYAQSGPDGLEAKLRKGDSDWFAPGYELVSGKSHPPLKPLFGKNVNDLSTEEMLQGFMLGVWLLEGRKDDGPRFLRFTGRNEVEQGAREAFGLEINGLEERLARWAKEMRSGGK